MPYSKSAMILARWLYTVGNASRQWKRLIVSRSDHRGGNGLERIVDATYSGLRSYDSRVSATAVPSDSSLKGRCLAMSTACGIESVIQKFWNAESWNFVHDRSGNTACVTYALTHPAPLSCRACENKVNDNC